MEYDILSARNIRKLVNLVKEAAKDGWKPQGSAFVDASGNFCQTIIK